jgi:hypothetical protein
MPAATHCRWQKRSEDTNGAAYAGQIERDILAFWSEAEARFAKVNVPTTSPNFEDLQFLRSVTRDRLSAYKLLAQGLRQDDGDNTVDDGLADLKRVDDLINKHHRPRESDP